MINIEPLFHSGFTNKNVMSKIEWFKSEIEKRYVVGFHSLNPSFSKKVIEIKENETFLYDSQEDKLFIKGMRLGGLIYSDREWATSSK